MSSTPSNSSSAHASSESGSVEAIAVTHSAPSAIKEPVSHMWLWLVAVIGLAADLWSKHWAFTQLDPSPYGPGWVAVRGLLAFRRSLNAGALFGLGKGLTPVFIGASIIALGFVLFLFYHSDRQRRSLHIALGLVLAGAMGNLYDRAFMIADVIKFTENGDAHILVGKIINPGQSPILVAAWPEGTRPCFRPLKPEDNPVVRQFGVVRDFIKIEPHFKVSKRVAKVIGRDTMDFWPWVFNVADMLLVVGVSILMLNFWWERRQEKAAEAAAAANRACSGDAAA